MEIKNDTDKDVVYETQDGGTEDKPPFDKIPDEVRERLERLGPGHQCQGKRCNGRLGQGQGHKPTATEEKDSGPWNVMVIVDPGPNQVERKRGNVHWDSLVRVVPSDDGKYDLVVE